MSRHRHSDEFAAIVDVTSAYAVLAVMGPHSRAIMSEVVKLILFTVTFCANPANDLTCPPLIYYNLKHPPCGRSLATTQLASPTTNFPTVRSLQICFNAHLRAPLSHDHRRHAALLPSCLSRYIARHRRRQRRRGSETALVCRRNRVGALRAAGECGPGVQRAARRCEAHWGRTHRRRVLRPRRAPN